MDSIFGVLLGYGIFSLVIFGVITYKKRRPHITLGTFILLLVIVLVGLNYSYTKGA